MGFELARSLGADGRESKGGLRWAARKIGYAWKCGHWLRTNTYSRWYQIGAVFGFLKSQRKEVDMVTTSTASLGEGGRGHTLSVARLIIAGGLTAALIFILCWIGTFIPFFNPTHAYIALFTNADIRSGVALVEGTCWSLLFGALAGAAFALIYNATAALDRR